MYSTAENTGVQLSVLWIRINGNSINNASAGKKASSVTILVAVYNIYICFFSSCNNILPAGLASQNKKTIYKVLDFPPWKLIKKWYGCFDRTWVKFKRAYDCCWKKISLHVTASFIYPPCIHVYVWKFYNLKFFLVR